jgi:hypothetical protein
MVLLERNPAIAIWDESGGDNFMEKSPLWMIWIHRGRATPLAEITLALC